MKILLIVLSTMLGIALLVLLISYVTYYIAFYSSKKIRENVPEVLEGEQYKAVSTQMRELTELAKNKPHEEVSIMSFDGLRLFGRYYHCADGAPVEIMMHGYRGTAMRDMGGGVQRCFEVGRNVLLIDQRAAGKSEGHTISFGIKERYDCKSWVEYIVERFGKDVRIIITGISMGAATVMMATELDLPPNVVGVLADCGYSTPKDIINKVVDEMGLPFALCYPFIKLGARVFGGFDLEAADPVRAMRKCKIPVLFIHGEDDRFVPCEMSRICCEACAAPKMIKTIPGAGHGLSYLIDREGYVQILDEFTDMVLK